MERRYIKNVRIIRRLLERPDGSWTKYALAKASGASQPFGIKVVSQLEKLGLVKGTRVTDMEGLARHGARMMPKPLLMAEFYIPEPVDFLKKHAPRYALTTYFAENQITHHLFPTRCDAYVSGPALNGMRRAVLKEGLIGGGNTRIIVPVDEAIIAEATEIRGVRIVAPGQLMLDLVREGGPAMEAFEMMVNRYVRKG
jgi:hypothetical protein